MDGTVTTTTPSSSLPSSLHDDAFTIPRPTYDDQQHLLLLVMIDPPTSMMVQPDHHMIALTQMQWMQQQQPPPPSTTTTLSSVPPRRPCLVWLSLPPTVSVSFSSNTTTTTTTTTLTSGNRKHHHHPISLPEQLVQQCWIQECQMLAATTMSSSSGGDVSWESLYRHHYASKTNKISSLTISDQFRLWAQQTIYFSHVVVFWTLSPGQLLYQHHSYHTQTVSSWEHFIQWCADRRSVDGIPISIIMYNSSRSCQSSSDHYNDRHNKSHGSGGFSYRPPIPYHSSTMPSGIRVRHITTLPSTKTIFLSFWRAIYRDATLRTPCVPTRRTNHGLAVFLIRLCHSHPAILKHIWYLLEHQDHSMQRAMESIQRMVVAHYFAAAAKPSTTTFLTTVAVALCNSRTNPTTRPTTPITLSRRLTSLFYDYRYHRMLSSSSRNYTDSAGLFQQLEEYESDRCMSSIALQLYNYVTVRFRRVDDGSQHNTTVLDATSETDGDDLSTSTILSLIFGHTSESTDNTKSTGDLFGGKDSILTDADRQSIIAYIAKVVDRTSETMLVDSVFTKLDLFDHEVVRHQTSMQKRLACKINEFIVVLDHCITLGDVYRVMSALLLIIDENSASEQDPLERNNNVAVHIPCPRRDHVRALVQDMDNESNNMTNNDDNNSKTMLSLMNVPGIMYRLIQNRVSVTEIEWYQAFLDHVQSSNFVPMTTDTGETTTDWFQIFGCGIRHLQISGLIRRNEGRNNSIQYERTALVWCGGD